MCKAHSVTDLEAGARPYVRLQVLEGYIERLRALRGRDSDASGRQGYQNAINDAVKEAESMYQEIGRRTAQKLAIKDMGVKGPLSGLTPEQDARWQQRLRDLGRQFSEDARRNIDLWDSIGRLINPDDLNLSKDALKEIASAMGRISHDAQQWNAIVGSVENKVMLLNTELVSARKAMRGVIQDEMNFWSGLDAPDRDASIDNILKYREKATELQNVLDIRNRYSSIDEMRKSLSSARQQLEASQSIDATPRAKQDIEAGIKELERVIKLYSKGGKGLREMQTETQKLREQMLEGWDDTKKQNLIKYLTGIRLQLNDIESGVPPARHDPHIGRNNLKALPVIPKQQSNAVRNSKSSYRQNVIDNKSIGDTKKNWIRCYYCLAKKVLISSIMRNVGTKCLQHNGRQCETMRNS